MLIIAPPLHSYFSKVGYIHRLLYYFLKYPYQKESSILLSGVPPTRTLEGKLGFTHYSPPAIASPCHMVSLLITGGVHEFARKDSTMRITWSKDLPCFDWHNPASVLTSLNHIQPLPLGVLFQNVCSTYLCSSEHAQNLPLITFQNSKGPFLSSSPTYPHKDGQTKHLGPTLSKTQKMPMYSPLPRPTKLLCFLRKGALFSDLKGN